MSNNTILLSIVWLSLFVHVATGVIALWWYRGGLPLLPLLNLATALCVVGYWITWWYAYLFRGILWYATDQLVPLYAILVCVLCAFTLTGRYAAMWPHWLVFGIHTMVLLAAAVFFSSFRITRLI